jgi:hypothetical protein
MSLPAVTKLPQELIHAIIDRTTCDKRGALSKKDLGTCSLISKAWLLRSRQYLFRSISLYAGPQNRKRTLRFIKLLGSPLGTIAPHVRHLELDARDEDRLNKAFLQSTVLTAVEYLSIRSGNFVRQSDTVITSFFSSLSMLKYLRLAFCTFSSPHQLSVALSAAPHINLVGLDSVRLKPNSSNTLTSFRDRLARLTQLTFSVSARSISDHLRILEIHECSLTAVSRWLQSGGHLPTVDTLELTLVDTSDMPACSELMRMIGSSLTHLTIRFKHLTDWPAAGMFSLLFLSHV